MRHTAASARSIDRAASGFLRLRFVRAITAAWVVLFALVAVLLVGFGFVVARPDEMDEATILAVAGLITLLSIPLLSAVFDSFPPRVVAFVCLIASLILLLIGLAVITEALVIQLQQTSMTDYEALQNWLGITVVALSAPIFAEGIGWSWWQLRVSREDFLAVRGWRPPWWRLLSALRFRMGLPAFIANFGRGRSVLTAVYFLIAVLNLGLVAFIFAPVLASYIQPDNTLLTPFFIVGGFLALPIVNMLGAGAFLQRFASEQATKLYQDARDWDDRPPVVFLRSFDQDAFKLKARAVDPIVRLPAGCGEARTLDEILLEHASPYGPVIAIGDPRNPVPPLGAARVYVPDEGAGWQHVVWGLVESSSVVVMCPRTSEGVKWELDVLAMRAERLRIVYIASPELGDGDNTALFSRLLEFPPLPAGQRPIAAFRDPKLGWQLLTTAKQHSVQSCTVALNTALQALFGITGTPIKRPRSPAVA